MAGETPDLVAHKRARTGKGRRGATPAVAAWCPPSVYGGEKEPLAIELEFNMLLKRLRAGRFLSQLFNLKVEGEDDVRVICRNVQRDVVKDLPTHADFMRLRRTSKVALFIPVDFQNHAAAPGIKRGGVLYRGPGPRS